MNLLRKIDLFSANWVAPLANVVVRVYIGLIFFRSGLAKTEDFEETIEFFEDDWALPFLSAEPAAWLATIGELVLPVLLFVGLFTRISAAGLFVMAAVIQCYVFQMPEHLLWMSVLGLLVAYGGDRISLDNFVRKVR